MFIAIIGTRLSGQSSITDYLVRHKSFTPVHLSDGYFRADSGVHSIPEDITPPSSAFSTNSASTFGMQAQYQRSAGETEKHMSFLSMDAELTPLPSPAPFHKNARKPLHFHLPSELLDHVTRNWRTNFVTLDIRTKEVVEVFMKRPFFMLVRVDAPVYDRFKRSNRATSLEEFVKADDDLVFGPHCHHEMSSSLNGLDDLVNIRIVNNFQDITSLHQHLDSLDLLDPAHLRPDWDTYFMTLASLASHRSNCMKRRVGAVLVRDNRILATGYNGTPRNLRNCNEGGCSHCNQTTPLGNVAHECVCLHAEENALLETGRDRVGDGAVLYCNTCPCLKCTIKIIQTGVKCVVYNLTYKVDAASAKLFEEAGVQLRRFDPSKKLYMPAAEAHQHDKSQD